MVTQLKPAILGAPPLFSENLRLVVPDLPSFSSMQEEFAEIVESGILTKGRFLQEFEDSVANYCGTKYAVGVSSCTSGLLLAHQALELGGEVIIPSFTFLASALGCAWNNTVPVFVDIDQEDWTVDLCAVEAAITPETTAILATHVFGNPCHIKELEAIAKRHDLKLMFDAAHGFGAQYQGNSVGNNGELEVFSLSPTKLLISGEGGIITLNDEELYHKLKVLREYGNDGKYDLVAAGLNARMPETNALLGLHGLRRLEDVVSRRIAVAQKIIECLAEVPGLQWQKVRDGNRSSYKDLVCLVDEKQFGLTRDQLAQALTAEKIETRNYYDPPCHAQKYWQNRCRIGAATLPVTDRLGRGALTIPLQGNMSNIEIEKLVLALQTAHKHSSEIKRAICN